MIKCCFCSKEIKGFGNSAVGAVDSNADPPKKLKVNLSDKCCDDCFKKYVIPGRKVYLEKISGKH